MPPWKVGLGFNLMTGHVQTAHYMTHCARVNIFDRFTEEMEREFQSLKRPAPKNVIAPPV